MITDINNPAFDPKLLFEQYLFDSGKYPSEIFGFSEPWVSLWLRSKDYDIKANILCEIWFKSKFIKKNPNYVIGSSWTTTPYEF